MDDLDAPGATAARAPVSSSSSGEVRASWLPRGDASAPGLAGPPVYLAAADGASARGPEAPAQVPARAIETNRRWEVLTRREGPGAQRALLDQAARELGDWSIHLAGLSLDGDRLRAAMPGDTRAPLLRALREALRRPVDLDDFLLFLDDVLREGREGLRGQLVWVTPGRARKAGIFVHPDDVFLPDSPRLYGLARGGRPGRLSIERPRPQVDLPPARDGDALGPGWAMRYQNPRSEQARLAALTQKTARESFEQRIRSLIRQLREQGADVHLSSTVRSRQRGYLMWGAFMLGRSSGEAEVRTGVAKLDRLNRSWLLDIPIRWRHPAGWAATRQAAREMADTYQVVYATERGARSSNHYTGSAVDLVAVGLPRSLTLRAPGGGQRRFDLSAAHQTRDLSLTPELIEWIEAHFELEKLRSDYPHWDDASAGP